MRKTITSSAMAAALLLSSAAMEQQTEAATVMTSQSLAEKKINMPDISSIEVVQSMKTGSYIYKGIDLNTDEFGHVKPMWGSPAVTHTTRDRQSTTVYWTYGLNDNLTVIGAAMNKDAKVSSIPVKTINWTPVSPTSNPFTSKVKSNLGSPTSSDNYGTYIIRTYGEHIDIELEKIDTKWYIQSLSYHAAYN